MVDVVSHCSVNVFARRLLYWSLCLASRLDQLTCECGGAWTCSPEVKADEWYVEQNYMLNITLTAYF